MLNLTPTQLAQILQKQREIDQKLDVAYTCYALKIKESEFWGKELWGEEA